MANDTPRLSFMVEVNQHAQRLFDEVSNERDTAIAENTKLKNANADCLHIIANKQKEIEALHAEIAALHNSNRRKSILGGERQQIKNKRAIGSSTASRQDATLRQSYQVATSVDTSSNAFSISPVFHGANHDNEDLEAEVIKLKQNYDLTVKAHKSAMRQARNTQKDLNSQISKLERQVNFITDERQRAARQETDLTVQLDGLQHRMDAVCEEYDAAMQHAAYETTTLQNEVHALRVDLATSEDKAAKEMMDLQNIFYGSIRRMPGITIPKRPRLS